MPGALILAATFLKGFSTDESAGKIRTLAKIAFQDRSRLPIFSRARKLARFCLGDGIYPSGPVERISKELFGSDTSILDSSYATSIGTKLGFPVATVDKRPSSRIFSNYTRTTATGQLSGERLNTHLYPTADKI